MLGTRRSSQNDAASVPGDGLRAWRTRYPDLADCAVRNVLDRISGKRQASLRELQREA